MIYTVKKVGIESSEQLLHLWTKTFTQAYQEIHSPENLHAYCIENYSRKNALAVLSSDQFNCTVAYNKKQPAGYYLLNYQPCPTALDGESTELKQIYILANEYGKGLGKRLFKHAVNTAQQLGYQWLWLCVSNANYRAQKFYKKLMFEPLAPGPIIDVGTDQLASTIMALNIKQLQ